MADTFKVLSQTKPVATTLTDSYTVPGATTATVSSITVCEQGGAPTTFRISVAVAGAADTAKQYVAFDAPIKANETLALTLGLTLGAADVVRVYNALATLSFNVFGVEVS